MANDNADSLAHLLRRWHARDADALDQLLPLVYADLRRIAAGLLRSNSGHTTLQTTALVHEVFLRLLGRPPASFRDGAHLLNAAAKMMRQILVDRARAAASVKRGGAWLRDDFTEVLELALPDNADLEALDAALNELEAIDRRMAQVVELRFLIGLGVAETAAVLGITERTAHRDWIAARAWLKTQLDA